MGDPMSSHDGIICCPAMRENSEEKYIVKIISVPASQKQLDALLLTGAYPDAASAMDYYKEVADGIVKEAELLKQLAKLEGFLAYDNWQIVPMEGSRLGYQVYLLSPYKRSLEKHLRRNTMTHLGAVNLGLDLCAALSICRRAGFMHVDLKPSNIYLTGKREYRIGDLGFVKLSTLKYTSLPSKYCSSYTPPELHDALNTLNPTADIYAVGMILYQIYNDGVLPFDDVAPATALPAPLNADYELAEIILKACDPNPRKRYQTPIEMGKALVEYMKRNNIQDDPIVPPAAGSDFLDASYEPAAAEPAPAETAPAAETGEIPPVPQNEELSFLENLVSDETAPDEQDADVLSDASMTEEVSSIIAQADELMTEPEPEAPAEEAPAEEATAAESPAQEEDDFDWHALCAPDSHMVAETNVAVEEEEAEEAFLPYEEPRKKGGFLKALVAIVLLAALAFGGYFFYRNFYLLHIDHMEISSVEDFITVKLTTDVDDSLLSIVCTDTYGNAFTSSVNDHSAVFTGLAPGTLYKIEVTAEGFHSMSGSCSSTVSTVDQTQILDFSAKTGTEDGSVILSFTVEGPEQDWIMEYSAEGEEPGSISFTGHMVTVNNLAVGKAYTFKLVPPQGSGLYVVGSDTLEFTASANVVAEKLTIVSCADGVLTVDWEAPTVSNVESWVARCYSDNGYDETVTVTDTAAQFGSITADAAYTVEVTASGMTQNARAYVSANPTTITDLSGDGSQDGKMTISWTSNVIPAGGWLVMYTLNDGEASQVIQCTENTATIEPTIPGTTYHVSIQAADGSTVFGGSYEFSTKEAAVFNAKDIDGSKVTGSFLPTPDNKDWTYKDIADDAYTATYAPGSKVSLLLYSPEKAESSSDQTSVMFVFRDVNGNLLPDLTSTVTDTWKGLWGNRTRYCSLDLPVVPSAPGVYTVEVYFNRALMITKTLTITE